MIMVRQTQCRTNGQGKWTECYKTKEGEAVNFLMNINVFLMKAECEMPAKFISLTTLKRWRKWTNCIATEAGIAEYSDDDLGLVVVAENTSWIIPTRGISSTVYDGREPVHHCFVVPKGTIFGREYCFSC